MIFQLTICFYATEHRLFFNKAVPSKPLIPALQESLSREAGVGGGGVLLGRVGWCLTNHPTEPKSKGS